MPLRSLTLSAVFVALIAILAQVAVPVPFSPVPLSGQLIGVLLAGTLQGKRGGTLAVGAYLLLGAAGAPVFSMARGGLQILLGPTGGYLWGFIPAAFLAGLGREGEKHSRRRLVRGTAMMASLAAVYACGAFQLALILDYSVTQALLLGVIPFIPADLMKVAAACYLAEIARNKLERNGLGHLLQR